MRALLDKQVLFIRKLTDLFENIKSVIFFKKSVALLFFLCYTILRKEVKVMCLKEFKEMTKNTRSIKIYKVSNGLGHFSYQYYDELLKRWEVGCFKSYSDAVLLAFLSGFVKESNYTKFVVLERRITK